MLITMTLVICEVKPTRSRQWGRASRLLLNSTFCSSGIEWITPFAILKFPFCLLQRRHSRYRPFYAKYRPFPKTFFVEANRVETIARPRSTRLLLGVYLLRF